MPFGFGKLEPHRFELMLSHRARRDRRPGKRLEAAPAEIVEALAEDREIGGSRMARCVHSGPIGRRRVPLEPGRENGAAASTAAAPFD